MQDDAVLGEHSSIAIMSDVLMQILNPILIFLKLKQRGFFDF